MSLRRLFSLHQTKHRVGSPGHGGQMGFADIHHEFSYAYTTNRIHLVLHEGDPRTRSIIDAIYEAIDKLNKWMSNGCAYDTGMQRSCSWLSLFACLCLCVCLSVAQSVSDRASVSQSVSVFVCCSRITSPSWINTWPVSPGKNDHVNSCALDLSACKIKVLKRIIRWYHNREQSLQLLTY